MPSDRAALVTPERAPLPSRADAGAGPVITVEVKLTLTIAGETFAIWGTNVEAVELRMTRYGLRGELSFWVPNDEDYGGEAADTLFAAFGKTDEITVELSLLSSRPDDEADNNAAKNDPVPLVVKGLVAEREVFEQAFRGTDQTATLARRYSVSFLDPVALYWKQHYPCALYTEKTLQDVIEEHKLAGIAITYEGESLTTKRPQLYLGLSPVERSAPSFYDWLFWLCDSRDLLFTYKYLDQTYRLAEALEEPPTDKVVLARLDLAALRVHHAEVPRTQARTQNGSSADPRISPISLDTALAPLTQDYLFRAPLGADFDARTTLETQRLRKRGPALHIEFAKLPLRMFGPGDCIDLTGESTSWKKGVVALPAMATAEPLRCIAMMLSLHKPDTAFAASEIGDLASFRMHCHAELEPQSERAPMFPPYLTPRYPRLVEGLVLSGPEEEGDGGDGGDGGGGGGGGGDGGGEEVEETYEIETNEETSLQRYKVKLPVYANQIIRVPFDPGTLSGHFYFPIYKGARVLIALDYDRSTLRSFLDWRIGNQLPQESQGNQLMMGKKPSSCVTMQTVYTDEKIVFTLQRKSDKDLQVVRISEGSLTVFLGEGKEDTAAEKIKTTKIAITKDDGVSLTIENPDAKLTQSVTLDGTTLTMKVAGEQQTSTYTQLADSISIKAKTLTIEGETLTMKTTKASTWNSEDTLSVTSSKDMSFKSSAALNQKADGAGKFEADALTFKANQAAKLEGTDTTVKGLSSLKGEAPQVTIEGSAASKLKGATVEVKASGMLTCEASGATTVKGAMVSISGNLIQVG